MEKKDDRAAILKNFGDALAALMQASLSEMNQEKLQLVGAALESGAGTVQLAIDTTPALVVVAYLRMCDGSEPMHELFRIDGSSLSAATN